MRRRIINLAGEFSDIFERKIGIPVKLALANSTISAIRDAEIYPANSQGFKSCLLFCHYNRHGLVLQQIRDLCLFFKSQNIDVVFITTKVDCNARDWIEKNLPALLIRKNLGRDFGAWKDGIAFLRERNLFEGCNSLYMVNDSLLVVSSDLAQTALVDKFIKRQDVDVIGLTESWQQSYHLQSYCLKFNQSILQSRFFEDYWSNYPLINSRVFSIEGGEILLSQRILAEGFSVDAVYSNASLVSSENLLRLSLLVNALKLPRVDKLEERLFDEIFRDDFTKINPSHRLWLPLLAAECPIFKRDLIEKNPEKLVSMQYFQALCNLVIDKSAERTLAESLAHLKYAKRSKRL
jgi:hypothetical protein